MIDDITRKIQLDNSICKLQRKKIEKKSWIPIGLKFDTKGAEKRKRRENVFQKSIRTKSQVKKVEVYDNYQV